ncbi:pseudouridine synthase [Methanomicrobiaceae archaeon CYW5]|uniref:tRNA pseudouridine(13) synthase TruD n=1 Tax=Methanovulcanius yangii TaxID=1789227 RepID=UPI0029C9F50E|nr:tRNA pseudouridine(13) synthase TruD [Methanovulcanius yangii]MBT8507457.1 pseudouridine synthase [Methanovulcanius yangii]
MKASSYPLEQDLGIEYYGTGTPGIGGRLRTVAEDFIVHEIPSSFPENGKYLICRLTKRRWEHQRAVKEIAKSLGISHRRISWAGTKDRNAVTDQLIAIYDISKDDLASVRLKDMQLEYVGQSSRQLALGDLEGNEFAITIRNTDLAGDELRGCLMQTTEELAGGVPNYFGLQRFGVQRPVTHVVGRHILQDDYQGAVEAYIAMEYDGESPEAAAARRIYAETKNPAETLKALPVPLSFERTLLHHLIEEPGDYRGALRKMPPKLLSMFISAYQSWLFNKALSFRIASGTPLLEPMSGDRIIFTGGKEDVVTGRTEKTAAMHIRRGRAAIGIHMPGAEETKTTGPVDEFMADLLDKDGITSASFGRAAKFVETRFAGASRVISLTPEVRWETPDDTTASLTFGLGPGQYATTVCREYMKAHPEQMV